MGIMGSLHARFHCMLAHFLEPHLWVHGVPQTFTHLKFPGDFADQVCSFRAQGIGCFSLVFPGFRTDNKKYRLKALINLCLAELDSKLIWCMQPLFFFAGAT